MITKLVSYHANPAYHVGHEAGNIRVAAELLAGGNAPGNYESYIMLCQGEGVAPYNKEVFDDYLNNVP